MKRDYIIWEFFIPFVLLAALVCVFLGIHYLLKWESKIDQRQIQINKVGDEIKLKGWEPEIATSTKICYRVGKDRVCK